MRKAGTSSISRRCGASLKDRDVFVALAARKRREIIDLLRDRGPLRAGEIACHFDADSQPAISRHLKILRECDLVKSASRGRENLYVLNSAPLADARDGWLATFGKAHWERLRALRDAVERR